MKKSIWSPGIYLILAFLILSNGHDAVKADEILAVDLKSAINMAVEHNENYQIAKKEVDKADGKVMEATSGAFPQITSGITWMHNWEVPVAVFSMNGEQTRIKFGTANNYTADLTLTQPIYAGGRTFTALRIAKLYKRLAHEMLSQARQDLKVQVYNGFYGALLANDVRLVNEESKKVADENLDVVTKMYNQGMVAEYDFLRAKVEVANLEPAVIKAKNDAEVAMNAFKNLLGLPLDSQIELKADYDSSLFILPPVDDSSAQAELLANRPEIRMSDLQSQMLKQAVSISMSGYRPSLYFSTSLQYSAQFDYGSVFDQSWARSITSVLSFTMPIFDSWKTPSQVKQARIDYKQSLLQEDATKKAMILAFQQSRGNYHEARNRLSAQGNAVELAKRGLSIAKVRYESGVGTQLEFSDARLSLSMAEINKAVAFHDLAVNYVALMRALGRELEPVN